MGLDQHAWFATAPDALPAGHRPAIQAASDGLQLGLRGAISGG